MTKKINSGAKTTVVKKTVVKKEVKKPVSKKLVGKKTKEELESMFNFDFGCDCSACPHHCGEDK